MSAGKILGRGTKRAIARIRWKRYEVVHAVVVSLVLLAFSVYLALWFELHQFD